MNSAGVHDRLRAISVDRDNYATDFVKELLLAAKTVRTSDLHLQPTQEGLRVLWRLDGVLQTVGVFPQGTTTNIVSRLKVLAGLLTYRTDSPQEGRIQNDDREIEMRVSTFPTLHGERAVIRFFAAQDQYLFLDQLGFPGQLPRKITEILAETSGGLLITGPAGSGKTTTLYACLREIVQQSTHQRSVVSFEDPIEVAVDGVAQSQVNLAAGLDLATGLRSLLRQDPEVIMVGEIRDEQTAELCMQASLTGQLVLTTFHAGSAAEALRRLMDMSIEPYLIRSGVMAVLCQRLVRCLCDCARSSSDESDRLDLPVTQVSVPVGCDACQQTGYRGRRMLAEIMDLTSSRVGAAILRGQDIGQIQDQAIADGMVSLQQRGLDAVTAGWTSPAEIRRVMGLRHEGPYC
ncbi:MAG: type II/IV secretion system protein [Planctomycetaceae bacterium]|nr:type II/IV secretion system protein [Planctomycetaceae bacterium]